MPDKGDTYKQSGDLGIGHMSDSEIKDKAKVAGVINEAEQQVQGNENPVIQKISSVENLYNNCHFPSVQKLSVSSPPPAFKQELDKLVAGKILYDEHKFNGNLAIISIELYQINSSKKICIKLTVSFGTLEVKIPKPKTFFNWSNETIDIQFGIKNSELCLNLENGIMPLKERKSFVNQDNKWEGIFVGEPKSPVWQFVLMNESITKKESRILRGNLTDEILGILEILKTNTCCEVRASLEISVNRNHIEIIDLDEGLTKKQKETKIGLLLTYLKEQLGNFDKKISLSKVAKEYDPTTIS